MTLDRKNNKSGFTLIEVMIVASLLSVVLGVLYVVAGGMAQAAHIQETKITIRDEARLAMQEITRNLRMASRNSLVSWDTGAPVALVSGVPSMTIGFQRAEDVPGVDDFGNPFTTNGLAINPDLSAGFGPMMGYGVDGADQTADGKTVTQLCEYDATGGGTVQRVIANNLSPVVNAPGTPQDAPNGGVTFTRIGNGVQVTLIMRRQTSTGGQGQTLTFRLVEFITPRNS